MPDLQLRYDKWSRGFWYLPEIKLGNRDWSRDGKGYSAQEELWSNGDIDVWRWYQDAKDFKENEEQKYKGCHV